MNCGPALRRSLWKMIPSPSRSICISCQPQLCFSLRPTVASSVLSTHPVCNLQIQRCVSYRKGKGNKNVQPEPDSDSEDSDADMSDEDDDELGLKTRTLKVPTSRVDRVLRAAGCVRNVVEEGFYGGLIRVNGEKILKKSTEVGDGDVVDLILTRDEKTPNVVVAFRVEIVSTKLSSKIGKELQARITKKLLIKDEE